MHFREQIKKTMDEYAAKENESEQGPIRGHKSKEDELVPITTPNPTKATDEEKKKKRRASGRKRVAGQKPDG